MNHLLGTFSEVDAVILLQQQQQTTEMNGAVVETDYRLDMLQLRNIEMQAFAAPMLGKARGPAQQHVNTYRVYCSFCNRHIGADPSKALSAVPPSPMCRQCEASVDVIACMRFNRCLCIPCLSKNGETCEYLLRR
jgi:hypothetical protein